MPIMLDGGNHTLEADGRPHAGFMPRAREVSHVAPACVEIGLLNNMPDAALQAAEQQFMELLATAPDARRPIRLHLFCLPDIARGPAAHDHLKANYADVADLGRTPLDALIVTGNEPRAAMLEEEPYWKSLTAVIDWAEHNTTSTIFSCLAAHAAVLHLDGVRRRRLPTKCSGVYRCVPVSDHALLAGAGSYLDVPHSRWNDLPEGELVANGYTLLTRTKAAGVDAFVKQTKSLFVFFQGHPEYHVDSLLREYRRDVGRFLRSDTFSYPTMPADYFSRSSEAALAALAQAAVQDRHPTSLADLTTAMRVKPTLARHWRESVVPLVGNWLDFVAQRKRRTVA